MKPGPVFRVILTACWTLGMLNVKMAIANILHDVVVAAAAVVRFSGSRSKNNHDPLVHSVVHSFQLLHESAVWFRFLMGNDWTNCGSVGKSR